MNQRLLVTLFAVGAAMTGCVASSNSGPDATLRVQNSSDFSIVELYVTPVGNPDWGRNLLAGDVLAPGESTTLGVNCDTYDVRLVDDSNVDCEVHDVDLCLNDADWIIHNNTCAVFGVAKAAREAAAAAAAAAAAK
jgi:hypothetical protein